MQWLARKKYLRFSLKYIGSTVTCTIEKKKIFKKKYWKMSRNYKHLIDILVRLTPTFHEIMLERLVGSLMWLVASSAFDKKCQVLSWSEEQCSYLLWNLKIDLIRDRVVCAVWCGTNWNLVTLWLPRQPCCRKEWEKMWLIAQTTKQESPPNQKGRISEDETQNPKKPHIS